MRLQWELEKKDTVIESAYLVFLVNKSYHFKNLK